MTSENPKIAPVNPWTSVPVRRYTAKAVADMRAAFCRKYGKSISQDLVVATALERCKVSDLPAPEAHKALSKRRALRLPVG